MSEKPPEDYVEDPENLEKMPGAEDQPAPQPGDMPVDAPADRPVPQPADQPMGGAVDVPPPDGVDAPLPAGEDLSEDLGSQLPEHPTEAAAKANTPERRSVLGDMPAESDKEPLGAVGGQPQPTELGRIEPTRHVYAGALRRLFAWIIDGFVLWLFIQIAMIAFGSVFAGLTSIENMEALLETGDVSVFVGVILVLTVVGGLAYYLILEGGPLQASLGKRALGIKVVKASGQFAGYGPVLIRTIVLFVLANSLVVGYILAIVGFMMMVGGASPPVMMMIFGGVSAVLFLLYLIGGLMMIFSKTKQGVHDRVAGTIVVKPAPPRIEEI